ncbi:MAG: ATP-binding cassette domain-containing protein [Marinicellaceae bacterium]
MATSVVDLFGLALFIPILAAIADSGLLKGSGILAQAKQFSGIESNNVFLLYLFIFAFIFFMLRSLFILWSNWRQTRFVYDINKYIGTTTYAYYLGMKYEDFMKYDSSQVVRELTISHNHFASFLIKALLLINSELVVLFLVVFGIAIYDVKVFFLILVTIFPVAVLFNLLVKKKMSAFGKRQNELTPKLYKNSNRGIFGFIDVKLRAKEKTLLNDYSSTISELNEIGLRTSVVGIIPAKLFELVTVGGLLLIFVYGAFLADNPNIVLPLIALYAAAGYRVIPSLSKIIPSFLHLQQYAYLFKIYTEPLKEKANEHILHKEQAQILTFETQVDLKDITFHFKDEKTPFFNSINLTVKKGETIGIIGRSGSGKTTLVKMIAGFIQPQKGAIYVDSEKLTEHNFSAWRKKLSYVQQSPYIENTSLARNIAFLEENINEELLLKSIQEACLGDLITSISPFDFEILENGKNLSGGQKQRILIARALYHQAEFIILDEATSALDNETENEINDTVANLKKIGTTLVIIAHRYSTLKHTDRIIEMESGSIINEMSYANLEIK